MKYVNETELELLLAEIKFGELSLQGTVKRTRRSLIFFSIMLAYDVFMTAINAASAKGWDALWLVGYAGITGLVFYLVIRVSAELVEAATMLGKLNGAHNHVAALLEQFAEAENDAPDAPLDTVLN